MSNVSDIQQKRKPPTDADVLAEIERFIKEKPENSRIRTITPFIAQKLLELYNQRNRPKKPKKIREFADDMRDNVWKLTGDTIKFSDRDRLTDGQNRLFACVESKKPFRTHLVFGIDDDAFPWMDRGKTRDGADALSIFTMVGDKKVGNARDASRAVRWITLFRNDEVQERTSYTPSQIIEAYKVEAEKHPGVLEVALKIARRINRVDDTPIGLAAALTYLFMEANEEFAKQFCEAWATGNFQGNMEVVRKASEFINQKKFEGEGRVHDVTRAAIWVTAWNLALQRRKGTRKAFSMIKRSSPFPRIEGGV